MNQKIQDIITACYAAFDGQRRQRITAVCSDGCCISANNLAALTSQPVQQLERSAIFDYLGAAEIIDTGNPDSQHLLVNEVKPLLPRILELFNNGELIRHSPEITFNKLHLDSNAWTDNERELVRQFAIAHFQRTTVEPVNTTHDSEYFTLTELVQMGHLADLDSEPLLTLWENV